MRHLIAAIVVFGALLAPRPAYAWGFEVHRFITARAIEALPREIRPFFEKFRTQIVEHSIDPDLWRTAGFVEEPPRHFVDMDAYGAPPFDGLPRDFDEAVNRYGRDFVERNGSLPWRTQEIFDKLVEAFAQKGPYSRENIKFFSSVLGHYVADGHVPLHAALNYDGQLTGQWGIHSRFETELFERYRRRLKLERVRIVPMPKARDFMFETLTASFPLTQPILEADMKAVAGREVYDEGYFEMFFERTRPILERRLSESIASVASLIASAWEQAGRPALPVEAPPASRKVRRQ
jgi:hypothetical protein